MYMPGPADDHATRAYLYSLKNKGAHYGIDRMWRLADALGHPQHRFPIIHVAGTNGKGSTCAILEALYRANGYTTGLYTSPHLVHLGERVQVNRKALSASDISAYTVQLRPIAHALGANDPDAHPTFFEFMTAMALLRFADAKVDIALVETGLGGRLDATNIVDPELSIITSVSLDHMEQLGDTIEQICTEKAGIIKAGKPVLIGQLSAAAEAVVRRIAQEKACPVYTLRERFSSTEALPQTNLAGSFQRWNAGTAVYATEILKQHFPITVPIAPVLQTIDWPGRWDSIQLGDKTLILDATHNPEGANMLDENLQVLIARTQRKPIIIVGILGEFRARNLLQVVSRYARELHLVMPNQSRATPTDVLASYVPAETRAPVYQRQLKDMFPAVGVCRPGRSGDYIVVTGSLYLIGEVLEQLRGTEAGDGHLQDRP